MAISNYEHLRQCRMPRTSGEAGQAGIPLERSRPVRAWGLELIRLALCAWAVAMAIGVIAVVVAR